MKLFTNQLVYGLLYHLIATSNALSVIKSPSSITAFVNDDIEFQCEIRNEDDRIPVWIIDYDPDDGLIAFAFANNKGYEEHYEDGHGNYSEYITELGDEFTSRLTLKIDNVQLLDEGTYGCGYAENYEQPYGLHQLGDQANLTLLIAPEESNPHCSFSPNPANVKSTTDTATIELSCQLSGGRPPPSLTWYKGDSSYPESPVTYASNTLLYTLTANDNGVSFTCTADGPALDQEGSCTITPLRIIPTVLLSSTDFPALEHSNVSFFCSGSGLPRISKTVWLYNGQVIPNNNMPSGLQIVDSNSELRLTSIQVGSNNDVVTCYVETPSGLSNQQSVSISVVRLTTTAKPSTKTALSSTTTPSTTTNIDLLEGNSEMALGVPTSVIIPIASAAGGVVLLIIVLGVIIRACYICRSKSQRNRTDSQAPIIPDRSNNNVIKRESVDKGLRNMAVDPVESVYVISKLPEDESNYEVVHTGESEYEVVSTPRYETSSPIHQGPEQIYYNTIRELNSRL